ncbi:MAG: hypothetical protein IKG56_03540 [Clostridia bacterium]|nr:hypothetical protein [Clostridia bacterium]
MKKIKMCIINETGITLISLVVTILVLLILAGVSINMIISNNGLIQKTKKSSEVYHNSGENEIKEIEIAGNFIDDTTIKLSQQQIEKVTERIKDNGKALQEINYNVTDLRDQEGNPVKVTVEGKYNGGLADQTFTQSDLLGTEEERIKWYVLSADQNGINIVSGPTKKKVQFKESSGYDNCLYYLNKISTELFVNLEIGVTSNRIHAFKLTDLKHAAELLNERTYNWEDTFVRNAPYDNSGEYVWNEGKDLGKKVFTPMNKRYPGIYIADSNKEVVVDNQLYDEVPNTIITTDRGIGRVLEDGSNPARKLTVNYTYFSYYNPTAEDKGVNFQKEKLGQFGNSPISNELFNANGDDYWIASRCIYAGSKGETSSYAKYNLFCCNSGYIDGAEMCRSYGTR